MQSPVGAELDALVDAIAQRLVARFPGNHPPRPVSPTPAFRIPTVPIGEPDTGAAGLSFGALCIGNCPMCRRSRIGIAGWN